MAIKKDTASKNVVPSNWNSPDTSLLHSSGEDRAAFPTRMFGETRPLKVVDLFCGVGGLSRGFEDAGYEVVAAFDYWERAVETYRLNFSHPVFRFDLTDVEAATAQIRPFAPDLIVGGPPCQEFSSAGKRSEGSKAGLTSTFADIVCAVRPAMFVMENVERARSSAAYRTARATFEAAGYGLTERVLDASLCGVPQKRKRFFCIGILDGRDGDLNSLLDERLVSRPMTVRDYMGSEIDFEHYYRHPRNYARRAVFSVDEPSPTIRGVNRPVPQRHKRHANDSESPAKVVALSAAHRARIQTFPVSFRWSGSKTDQEQMIGNAVPVELGRYVANAISRYLDGGEGLARTPALRDVRLVRTCRILPDNDLAFVVANEFEKAPHELVA